MKLFEVMEMEETLDLAVECAGGGEMVDHLVDHGGVKERGPRQIMPEEIPCTHCSQKTGPGC